MNLWPLSSLSRLLSLHLAPAFADSLYLSPCFSLPSLCHSPSFQPVVQVFPQYELLGWYSTGDEATAVDLDIHRKVRQAQAHITWALRYNQRAARPSSTSLYSVLRLSCVSRVVILVADKRATPQAAPALRPVRFLGCSCFFRRTDVGAFDLVHMPSHVANQRTLIFITLPHTHTHTHIHTHTHTHTRANASTKDGRIQRKPAVSSFGGEREPNGQGVAHSAVRDGNADGQQHTKDALRQASLQNRNRRGRASVRGPRCQSVCDVGRCGFDGMYVHRSYCSGDIIGIVFLFS